MRLRVASSIALVALVALVAGCGGSRDLTVEVTPRASLADEPVHVVVRGVEPGQLATVSLRSTDVVGKVWRSSAVFRADADGTVDLDQAPTARGDYTGVWGMGLISSLKPTRDVGLYAWNDARPLSFDLAVRAEDETASATFTRRFSTRRLARTRLSIERDGLVGEYVAPVGAGRRPAVLVLGGSDGGLSVYALSLASTLAARGYPALALAYFAKEGLPAYLYRIRLEYFAKALRWLERRPEVEPTRIVTFGVSRGSEAALLLGVHFPRLVYGVVASVPSNVVNGPAWTIGGKDVPYTEQFGNPRPTDDPRAVIPVERIRGPVFAYCATSDVIWGSCPYARALVARLRRHRRPNTLVELDGASHYAGGMTPYAISSLSGYADDQRAVGKLWPRLLAFLKEARR
jgi:dienelactone hydrolase